MAKEEMTTEGVEERQRIGDLLQMFHEGRISKSYAIGKLYELVELANENGEEYGYQLGYEEAESKEEEDEKK